MKVSAYEVMVCYGDGACGRPARSTCPCGVVTDCSCGTVVTRHVCGAATKRKPERFVLAIVERVA